MSKKLILLLAAVAVLAAGGVALYLNRAYFLRPNFDKVGGTEFVFEVESDPDSFLMDDLCQALRRRIDPQGTAGVVVEAHGKDAVKIRVPDGKLHDDLVEAVP